MDFTPSTPEKEEVSLLLVDEGTVLRHWTQYEYASNFEVPADGWSFTIAADKLVHDVLESLRVGARVRLTVNDAIQGDGYIDKITIRVSRTGGTELNIQGRDRIAQVVDACADPTHTFKEGATLHDVLVSLFAPFGWDSPDDFVIDNAANRNAKTGIRGTPTTKGGKRRGPRPLKSFIQHQLRPYPREGVYQFAARVSKRHGLMIWPSADGSKIIVSTPDFESDPLYQLRRNTTGTTNVLDGEVTFDITNQATVLVADGVSGGGEFGRGRIKSIMANTAVYTDDPAFLEPWKRYPDAHRVLGHAFATPVNVPRNRTLFLHDEESKTQDELDNFLRREVAAIQRHSITAHYTVVGHGQNTPNGFVPWAVDTTVDVQDIPAGLNERMYVLGRTFSKSRQGTTTRLELIRLHTLELGEPAVPKSAPVTQTDGEIVRERRELEEQSQRT